MSGLPNPLVPILVSLADDLTEPWQAGISNSLGYAVALTHTRAIVWRYTQDISPSNTFKPLVIKLPFSSSRTTGHGQNDLPLGTLVHDSGAGEIALLVVLPLTGQIIYWESVVAAANTEQTRQKQQGLHGTVGGLFSGEFVTNITEAEPDGFLLAFSTGRVAHLAVRDPQGRPVINVQFLRNNAGANGGFLDNFKSVFSSASWRRDIAAVQVGPMYGKSHRTGIIATTQGLFNVWNLARHSAKTWLSEVDTRKEIFRFIQQSGQHMADENINDFFVLDFVFFPKPNSDSLEPNGHRLLVLTSFKDGVWSKYNLVDLTLRSRSVEIEVIHPLSFSSPTVPEQRGHKELKPQILLPEPAQTAFVVFEDTVVMVSLAKIEQSPSSQLQTENHQLPDTFQDILYLNRRHRYHIVGCNVELPDRDCTKASCVFLVHGFGLARVTVLPPKEGESAADRTSVTRRSKIEQAIFFGSMPDNLLEFRSQATQTQHYDEETEKAILEINDSIMTSTSQYIPALTPAMEHQLKLRATALSDLIKYAKRFNLKPLTRWKLLWSAEKMAAARALWQSFDAGLNFKVPKQKILLVELLDMISEKQKIENQPDRGETDIVRHYLMHDVWRIELVIPWAYKAIEELKEEGIGDPVSQAALASQAEDIQISVMEAAFAFREANAAHYGIGEGMIEDGIYQGDYEPLPQFWTSTMEALDGTIELAKFSRYIALENAAESPTDENGGLDMEVLAKIAKDNPRVVHLACQACEERIRWLRSRTDDKNKAECEALTAQYHEIRKTMINGTVDLELPDEGIKLGERYRDMEALVDVLESSSQRAQARFEDPEISDTEREEQEYRLDQNQSYMEKYFSKFGAKWADALYSKNIATGHYADLMDNVGGYQNFLTQYLRSKPECAKLSWINEVNTERNYGMAADNLLTAQKAETNLWCKKIEVSMHKLALLAAKEKDQLDQETVTKMSRRANRRLTMLSIQENLYDHVRKALTNAIDDMAKVVLLRDNFGSTFIKGKLALKQILERNFKKLVARQVLDAEELIDTLTLMDAHPDDSAFANARFFLALKLLHLTGFEKTDQYRLKLHTTNIWRRCMIQDDWESLNRTENKNDQEVEEETGSTALFKTLKAGYLDGKSPTQLQPYICLPSTYLCDRSPLRPPTSTSHLPPQHGHHSFLPPSIRPLHQHR